MRSLGSTSSTRLVRPSALEWIYLIVGLVLVYRYRWLFDDSFVYYRYVDNLLFLCFARRSPSDYELGLALR